MPHSVALLVLTQFCLLVWVCLAADPDAGRFGYYGEPSGSGPMPHEWGDNPEWRICKDGREQSPIEIVTKEATPVIDIFGLDTYYVPADASLTINSANTIDVQLLGDAGRFKIGDTTYYLRNFHFHSPSEHTIDGVRFPLELHLVHQSNLGELAVIGITYSYGEENAFLATFWDELPLLTSPDLAVNLSKVDVREPNVRIGPAYARYAGSLTTPPCTEKVTWTVVLGEANTVSQRQMWSYNNLLPYSNARPVQALNHRKVKRSVGIFNRR